MLTLDDEALTREISPLHHSELGESAAEVAMAKAQAHMSNVQQESAAIRALVRTADHADEAGEAELAQAEANLKAIPLAFCRKRSRPSFDMDNISQAARESVDNATAQLASVRRVEVTDPMLPDHPELACTVNYLSQASFTCMCEL